jgi:iron complex outermembrane recepter protein
MKKIALSLLLFYLQYTSYSQKDSSIHASTLSELSLEELMDIPIYSVSKMHESSFGAPLSSSVLTQEEIKRAGCTSIMEALRLVPGIIVREQSNGNYDIHIRGLDNTPPNLGMYFFTNSTTLVMIDNRPVYNYLHGGTFWETLPIDVNDVEKIEVVRGPSSAMYGPNAESGVINIITRKPEKQGWYANATAQYGRFNTAIANAAFGYKFNNRISAHVSGNFQNRERTQGNYYSVAHDEFVPLDTLIALSIPPTYSIDSVKDKRYPHPKLSMRKYGYNAFLTYNINNRASIEIQGGGQQSEVQNLFAASYLTTSRSQSYYTNMRARIYGLDFQLSYLDGIQSPNLAAIQWKWDFNTTDLVLDYKITQVKNLIITPGISYRRASYDDRKYVREDIKEGFFSAKVNIHSVASYLRVDYSPLPDKLRLVGAFRVDKFYNGPNKPYLSWQGIITYKPTARHIFRVAQSRANRSPLLIDNFLNVAATVNHPVVGPVYVELLGNKQLKLLTTDMLEFGYRGKIKNNLELDFVIYGSNTRNYSNILIESTKFDSSALRTNVIFRFQNLPLSARQIGGTVSINYMVGKFHFRPFVSVQHTTLSDYSPYAVSPSADSSFFAPNPAVNNIFSGQGSRIKHRATPTVYGGFYVNCQATEALNINMNTYFMSAHTQLESSNLTYNDGSRGVENISPRMIVNIVASYTFIKRLTVFTNFRNCFADKSREFFRGDVSAFKVSGGVNFEF